MNSFENPLFPEIPASAGIGALLEQNPFAVPEAIKEINDLVKNGEQPEYSEEEELYCEAIADYVERREAKSDDEEGILKTAWLAAQAALVVAKRVHPDYTPQFRLSPDAGFTKSDDPAIARAQTDERLDKVVRSIWSNAINFKVMATVSRDMAPLTDPEGKHSHERYTATMLVFGLLQNDEIYQQNQQAAQNLAPEDQAAIDELEAMFNAA